LKTFTDFIPNYKKETNIATLEKNLNEEIIKNKRLEEENKKLKDNLSIITQNYNNENEKLKLELEKLKIDNEKLKLELGKLKIDNERLKSELIKANKIISNIQNTQINNNEIKNLKDENIMLKNQLNMKDNEIKDLILKNQNNIIIDKPKYDINDIMVINFMSQDSTINEGIKCLSSDTFAEVEEKLYKKYDHLRNTNNNFLGNGKYVLRFKKVYENGIKDGNKIILLKPE